MGAIHRMINGIENSDLISRASEVLSGVVTPVMHRPRASDLLTGRSFGHNAHPMLVVAPLGCWISSAVLDLSGFRKASKRLIGVGVVCSVPAVVTGLAEWVDTAGAEKNLGTAHALANDVALGLFTGSWFARRSERHFTGLALSTLGLITVGGAGYLGGHLAYVRGVGINLTAFQSGPDQWQRLVRSDDLEDRTPTQQRLSGLSFVVVRDDDHVMGPQDVLVLEDRCTHRGAPLSDGELVGDCIQCPWHGSRFDLRTGEVTHGPATAPQPVYETRLREGWVEIRRVESGGLRSNPVDARVEPAQ